MCEHLMSFDPESVRIRPMLEYREKKSKWLTGVLNESKDKSILVFRINAPGPNKKSGSVLRLFEYGMKEIKEMLDSKELTYTTREYPYDSPEWLSIFIVELSAVEAKQCCITLEKTSSVGRLYDLDVYDSSGRNISREMLQLQPRTCFLCDDMAFNCSRSGKHTLKELLHFMESKALECF